MIAHLKHGEINKLKWDECITRSTKPLPYALSWYLDVVSPKWEALVLGDYRAVMPLPCKRKFGFNYLATPLFVQQLGVFGQGDIDVDTMVNAIPKSYSYTDLNFNEGNKITSATENVNILLGLNRPWKELAAGFSDNTKRNAKKTEKNGYHLIEQPSPDDIIALFKENKGKDTTFGEEEYTLLRKLVKTAQKRNACQIYSVTNTIGQICAGAIFITAAGRYVFLFSGNNDEARQMGAMHFLLSAFIEKHAEHNALLDFEGSNNKSLARFYLSFGGFATTYPKLLINRLPLALRFFKK